MFAEQVSPSSDNLSTSKAAELFKTSKLRLFNGELVLTDLKGGQSLFYLYLGCIIYATGGPHPVRRWQRNLAIYCPQISFDLPTLQRELSSIKTPTFPDCWEYQLLRLWVGQRKITREQATELIRAIVREVLFDVAQAIDISHHQTNSSKVLSMPIVLIDAEQAIAEAQQLWQVWWNANIADHSPNRAPIIKQPEQLRKQTAGIVYKILSSQLNGQKTLRDLAVQMKRDIVQLTLSLLPYIRLGWVELINLPDIPAPGSRPVTQKPSPPLKPIPQGPLIACVDDSPLICQTMEKLLAGAGYRFVGVNDDLRAIGIVLARKPDLIFLDLVMPNTNGYEICSQLRKLSSFRNTPIIILTGNDGVFDQARAKLAGASDFISKPIDAETVLGAIRKCIAISY